MTSTASVRTVILAAVEPSAASDQVIQTASAMVRIVPGGELHLVHVVDPGVAAPAMALATIEREAHGRAYLDEAVATAALLAGSDVTGHLSVGKPTERILHLASEIACDLVVVGTHGKRGFARMLGSVSRRIVRNAPCQVLIAREKQAPASPTIELPCPDCVAVQFESQGEKRWCARHAEHHVHAHLHYGTTGNYGGGAMLIRPGE